MENRRIRTTKVIALAALALAAAPVQALRLRYPLSPLPNAPQPSVRKADVEVHADSAQVLVRVELLPEPAPRDLYVAVFDQNGALQSTASQLVPAKAEKVEIKPFLAPWGKARFYQLALRPHPAPPVNPRIVGGYTGHSEKHAVAAPPEVTLSEADFYRSNAYKDSSVRFRASAGQGAPDECVLHGAVFDEMGTLLATAREPLTGKKNQRIDLKFGVLPKPNIATASSSPPVKPLTLEAAGAATTVTKRRTEKTGFCLLPEAAVQRGP